MIHSRNNVQGFTFIEVMIAITLLATFGTSLFMVQSNILSKIFNTHRQIIYNNDMQLEEMNFMMKVQRAILQKKSPDNVTIETKKKNPDRTIALNMKPIAEQSSLYKTFGKQVQLVQTTIAHDQYNDSWYSFIYIPELKEKQSNAIAEQTTPKATP